MTQLIAILIIYHIKIITKINPFSRRSVLLLLVELFSSYSLFVLGDYSVYCNISYLLYKIINTKDYPFKFNLELPLKSADRKENNLLGKKLNKLDNW